MSEARTEHGLAGKVAIVTGAGSGVGRATAVALAGEGMRLALVGRSREPLNETARLVASSGTMVMVAPTDIAAEAYVAGTVRAVVEELGGVDVLVAAAGIGRYGPVETYSL